MLDSKRTGQVFSTDISDMIENGLSGCQDMDKDTLHLYPDIVETTKKELDDYRCRCPISQELIELGLLY